MALIYSTIISLNIIIYLFIIQSSAQIYDLTRVKPIELAALGRVAKLGELYDSRLDQFLHISLIKANIPSNGLTHIHNKQTKLKYSFINTLEEKFRTMDISPELRLSIMGGLFSLEGSGKFFKDKKRSAKSAKVSLISSFCTEYEHLSITGSEMQSLINLDVLEQIDATHVVVGIQWGGNVFISVEDTNYEDRDQQTVEANLKLKLEVLAKTSGGALVQFDNRYSSDLTKFNFEIYGDLLPEKTPRSLVDALIFIESAPKLLLEGNKGKGKPMKYSLIPINLLRKLWKISTEVILHLNTIDESIVDTFTKMFDDMSEVEQQLNDLLDELKKYKKFIINKKINEVKNVYKNFKLYQLNVKQNLSKQLILIRSGNETVSKLNSLLNDAHGNSFSVDNIDLDTFIPLKREMKFLKMLSELNVTILDKDNTLQDYLSSNFNKDIYTLFYKDEFPDITESAMINFRKALDKRQSFGPSAVFTAIKFDILCERERITYFKFNESTKLSLFKNGKMIIDDFSLDTKIPEDNNPEHWSLYYVQTQLDNILKNPVPKDYIHVQFPGQAEPGEIWPNVNWQEITSKYAGLFFRAAGGNAATFGSEQGANSPRLSAISHKWEKFDNFKTFGSFSIKPGNWSDYILSAFDYDLNPYRKIGISFMVTNQEVRPRNKAIRIWKRI